MFGLLEMTRVTTEANVSVVLMSHRKIFVLFIINRYEPELFNHYFTKSLVKMLCRNGKLAI